jgi:hypothetical protein
MLALVATAQHDSHPTAFYRAILSEGAAEVEVSAADDPTKRVTYFRHEAAKIFLFVQAFLSF